MLPSDLSYADVERIQEASQPTAGIRFLNWNRNKPQRLRPWDSGYHESIMEAMTGRQLQLAARPWLGTVALERTGRAP